LAPDRIVTPRGNLLNIWRNAGAIPISFAFYKKYSSRICRVIDRNEVEVSSLGGTPFTFQHCKISLRTGVADAMNLKFEMSDESITNRVGDFVFVR
jgi:hypothetical protein